MGNAHFISYYYFQICILCEHEWGGINEISHCLKVSFSSKIYKYFLYDNSNNTGLFIIGEGGRGVEQCFSRDFHFLEMWALKRARMVCLSS